MGGRTGGSSHPITKCTLVAIQTAPRPAYFTSVYHRRFQSHVTPPLIGPRTLRALYIYLSSFVCLSFLPSFCPSVRPSGTLGGHARRARPKGAPEGRARPEGGRARRAPGGRASMGPPASGGGGFVYFISGTLGLFHCHYIRCNDISLTVS